MDQSQYKNEYSNDLKIKEWIQNIMQSIMALESDLSNYLDTENIEIELANIIVQNMKGMKNLCVECGEDLGECNPRQLCGKTFCYSTHM